MASGTWHERHREELTIGQRIADATARTLGSWPFIMMSQNRQAERDRYQAQADFETNVKAEREIEHLQTQTDAIEAKIDRLLAALEAR